MYGPSQLETFSEGALPGGKAAPLSRNGRIDMRENLHRPLVTPTLRGVHHLALCTDDMKATIDFYVAVLGMPLVHAMKVPPGLGTGPGNRGNPPYEGIRHYFFDMGRDGLLAFFEMPKGAKERGDRNALGAMQHVSFAVSPKSQARIRERLDAHSVPYDGPLEILPGIFSIYVFDPNDIRLEFSCQPSNGEGEPCIVPQ